MGALIFQANKILLVERAGEPLKGWWSLPGGGVETGETLETALRREIREETGLEIGDLQQIEIFERIMLDSEGKTEYHYVLIDYLCQPAGGELRAGDDAGRVAWFTEEELATLRITEGTPRVIAKGFKLRLGK